MVWVAFITVLFMLPQVSPVTAATFNYTPVAVLVVLGFAGHLVARLGPQLVHRPEGAGPPEELAAAERELESLA